MSIRNTVLNNEAEKAKATKELNDLQKFYMAVEATGEDNEREAKEILTDDYNPKQLNERLSKLVTEQAKRKEALKNFYKSQKKEGRINFNDANEQSFTFSEMVRIPHNMKLYGDTYEKCIEKKKRGVKPNTKIQYGRMIIDGIKLLNNELSVNYIDTKFKPTGYKKNRKVSNEFKNLLINMMEGKGVNISDLSPSEQKFLRKVNKDSMMDKDITGGSLKDLERLTQRFEVLKGEMGAGNDNKDIKNEISKIINRLVQLGALTVEDAVRASKKLIEDV